MDLHQSDKHQENTPDHAEAQHDAVDAALFICQPVADKDHGQLNERIGHQCIAHSHIDIPEPALAFKQGSHSPVGDAQNQERQQQRSCFLEYVDMLDRCGDKLEIRTNQLQHPGQQEEEQEGMRRSDTAAFFMNQIPETVKWMGDYMQCVAQRLAVSVQPGVPLISCGCRLIYEPCCAHA